MPESVNGFNNKDTRRIGRSVRVTERLQPPSLGGDTSARRGGGIQPDKGTLQNQCKVMLTDNQVGWGWPLFHSIT